MEQHITFVGLDVHKDTISVALADGGSRDAASFYGQIENSPPALSKLAAKLARRHGTLHFAMKPGHAGMACTGNC
jgi:hypothetical protein